MTATRTAMPTAAETKFWTASPAIWLRYDIVVLAAVVLPVRVRDEARGRVERDVRRDGREAVRVQEEVALEPEQRVEESEEDRAEDEDGLRVALPVLLPRGPVADEAHRSRARGTPKPEPAGSGRPAEYTRAM